MLDYPAIPVSWPAGCRVPAVRSDGQRAIHRILPAGSSNTFFELGLFWWNRLQT